MYWGCGPAAALSSRLMCSRGMLGPTTTSTRRRWISSFWQLTAVQQSPLTLCLNTRMASNSVVQRVTLRSWVWESCSRAGAIGSNVFQRGVSQLSSWTHVSSLGHSGATLDSLGCSCRCQKGKHNRDGFDYAIPACFSGGFFWAKEVLEAHRTLAPAGNVCPACGSETKAALGQSCNSKNPCRARWRSCPEEVITYSWRRISGLEFLSYITGQAHRLIPRCVIIQANASNWQRGYWWTIRTLVRCQQADAVQSNPTSSAYQPGDAPVVWGGDPRILPPWWLGDISLPPNVLAREFGLCSGLVPWRMARARLPCRCTLVCSLAYHLQSHLVPSPGVNHRP